MVAARGCSEDGGQGHVPRGCGRRLALDQAGVDLGDARLHGADNWSREKFDQL